MITAKTPQLASCERVVVTTANGRVYDLGAPDALFFRLRVYVYRIQRFIEKWRTGQ